MTSRQLDITDLGSNGDGVALFEGERLHVPFALPGETVTVEGPDKALSLTGVIVPSPDRTEPPCPHFGVCGGCALQHLSSAPYLAFKRNLVARALASRGLDPSVVAPCVPENPHTRRRATFTAVRKGKTVAFGFHRRKSRETVPIEACCVISPALTAALPRLRDIACDILRDKGEIAMLVTVADNGLDLHVSNLPKGFSDRDAMRVTGAGLAAGFIRVSLEGHDALTQDAPVISAGDARIRPPPGGFLQATPGGEAALARLVAEHVTGARKIADLFAGSGTFALRLASGATVHAVEGDAGAVQALEDASRRSAGVATPVTTECRNLHHRPLLPGELNRFDAVVLDPPRAGAQDQCAQLVRSTVQRIAYVSCNPGSLSRDLRILVDGGYALTRVTPVDQFLWSAHVEAVAELTRR